MITINRVENCFKFEVKGMHKLWAFKSQLIIPVDNILKVHQNTESIKGWKGWRAPGTNIDSIITAGTFYKENKKIFWDVVNIEKCIIIDLKDEEYNQLIIEVDNIENAIALLTH